MINGFGLVLSAFVAKSLGSDVRTATILYCALTAVHLISNYRSLKLVALDWLNGWRLHLLVEEFLNCVYDKDGNINGNIAEGSIIVPNPMEASEKEPLLFLPEWRSMGKQSSKYPIRMGVSFNKFSQLSLQPSSMLRSHLMKKQNERKDNYVLTVGRSKTRFKTKRSILVSYFSNSSNSEKAKAYLHGCLVRRALVPLLSGCNEDDKKSEAEIVKQAEETAERELIQLWPVFERCVTDAGWKLDKTECSTEGFEMYFE